MHPMAKLLIALVALMCIWMGVAILIAAINAALAGKPDEIIGMLWLVAA